MVVGTQFSGTLAANSTGRWFTYDWRPDWHVVWTVVSTTPSPGAAQIEWEVEVQRASPTALTYWITIRNLTGAELAIEARYAILN